MDSLPTKLSGKPKSYWVTSIKYKVDHSRASHVSGWRRSFFLLKLSLWAAKQQQQQQQQQQKTTVSFVRSTFCSWRYLPYTSEFECSPGRQEHPETISLQRSVAVMVTPGHAQTMIGFLASWRCTQHRMEGEQALQWDSDPLPEHLCDFEQFAYSQLPHSHFKWIANRDLNGTVTVHN